MDIDMTKPLPAVQPWTERFWEAAREGKLLVQVCQQCQARIFTPRKRCPECWSADLDWIESTGKGTLYSFTTAYAMVEPRFQDELPYTVAFVELAEGIRMMTRIVDCDPADLAIGMEVEVVFHTRGDFRLPYFRSARGG